MKLETLMSRKNDGRKTTSDYRRYLVDARDWMRRGMIPPLAESTPVIYQDSDKKMQDEVISLIWTPCNFGGWRVWFVCPKCNKKVAVIYTAKNIACRHCYDLKYASQSMNDFDRGVRLIDKLRKRLRWPAGFGHGTFGKAKHMHRKTFYQLHIKYNMVMANTFSKYR